VFPCSCSVFPSLISPCLWLISADLWHLPTPLVSFASHSILCLLCLGLVRGLLQPLRRLQKGQGLQQIKVDSVNSLVELWRCHFSLKVGFWLNEVHMSLCDQLHHQMLSKQKLHHAKCTLLQMLHVLLQGALLAPQVIMEGRRMFFCPLPLFSLPTRRVFILLTFYICI
jgi:hypothetical protein